MVSRLTLVPGESVAHGLRYWDMAVDGRLLRELLSDASAPGPADPVGDHVPVLVHSWPGGIPVDVLVLLGERPAELPTGRVPVFVCPACGDLGCGATTVRVERTREPVVWRDFGWETDYTVDEDDEDHVPVPGGPFVFAREQYEGELRRFVDTFDAVRASPASARPAPQGGGDTDADGGG